MLFCTSCEADWNVDAIYCRHCTGPLLERPRVLCVSRAVVFALGASVAVCHCLHARATMAGKKYTTLYNAQALSEADHCSSSVHRFVVHLLLELLELPMSQPLIITIDGPAGAGKSTLGELLARRLGYLYFDTGVMYRALAWAALQQALDLDDALALENLARWIRIEVVPPTLEDGRQYTVLADGEDVTWAIRTNEVDRTVSRVARYSAVRAEMIRQQREIGRRGRVVMVGRDIGSIVMPDAPLKIYLDASIDARAQRRSEELRSRGQPYSLERVRDDLARRDELDRHVMLPADDALILLSDNVSPDEEVDWILERIRELQNVGSDVT